MQHFTCLSSCPGRERDAKHHRTEATLVVKGAPHVKAVLRAAIVDLWLCYIDKSAGSRTNVTGVRQKAAQVYVHAPGMIA